MVNKINIEEARRKQDAQRKRAEERLAKEKFKEIKQRLAEKGRGKIVKQKFRRKLLKKIRAPLVTGRGTAKRKGSVLRMARAAGALPSRKKRSVGRPKMSYKYGMPVQQWKKLQSQRRAQRDLAYKQQVERLGRRGLSPQQVSMSQQQATALTPEQQAQQRNIADEELTLHENLSKHTISPHTQTLLDRLRRIQLKGARDDVNQQRVQRERLMLSKAGNLMDAHKNMRPVHLNFTGVPEDNILSSPSVFKEDASNNILRQNRLNILQTREAGHNLQI